MEEIRYENEVVEYFDSRPVREKVFYHVQGRPLPRRVYQAASVPVPMPMSAPAVQSVEIVPPQPKKKKRRVLWIVLIVIAAALLLAAAGLGIGYLVGSNAGFHWEAEFGNGEFDGLAETERPYTEIPAVDELGGAEVTVISEHGETMTPQEIYARVNPAVVSVVTEIDEDYAGYGTGMIFTQDGFILTNAHVIEEGVACAVYLSNGDMYEAKLVGYDAAQDLAVLKIEAEDLPCVEFGDSDLLTVGDPVYAIGNPLGYELRGTLTDGIVSAINRDVYVDGITMTLIQTNAALNSGNSGGPLINQYGQVVGVNVIKMMSSYSSGTVEGLGFAIPISATAHKINELIETGKTTPEPVIGFSVTLVAQKAAEDVTGLEVKEVTQNSAADKAGIQVGDYVLAVNGEEVKTSDDVIRHRRGLRPGDEMEMTIWRDGETFDVTLIMQNAE